MITIGTFFFKYRNILFIFLYLALFIPSPLLFTPETFGEKYYLYPIILGLAITVYGQLIRGVMMGGAYIARPIKDKEIYADKLITEGIFNHCRNPLYVGNILMFLGIGILANSLLYVGIIIPLFVLIYQAIVLAEENFLRKKFGKQFDEYCSRVSRWWINFKGIGKTFKSMKFNLNRWILKEYNTQFIWMAGIALLVLKYPEITGTDTGFRNTVAAIILIFLALGYLLVRFFKKSGKMVE